MLNLRITWDLIKAASDISLAFFIKPRLIYLLCFLSSCNTSDRSSPHKEQKESFSARAEETPAHPFELLKDFRTWYKYTYYHIRLCSDFTGLGSDSSELDKKAFLDSLRAGGYIAYKIKPADNKPVYKLLAAAISDSDIRSTMLQMAEREIVHYNMEGKELPDYQFVSLNGNTHNKASAQGNILVIKCWFIRCTACVKEFPRLNRLVDEYKGRRDIKFISLATDYMEDLISFLKTKKFNYEVVPDSKTYMEDHLNIKEYPTHLLVNKKGIIVKVVNDAEDLIPFLKELSEKEEG